MKKIIKSLLIFAAATTAFASCSKADINESAAPETPAVLMAVEATAYAPEETRVNMGDKEGETYPMTWDDTTESFKVVEIYGSSAAACSIIEDSYKNNDGTASFQFNVDASHEADTYKYYAISPAPTNNASQAANYFHVTIPAEQTQTDKVDPAAIVLVGTAEECTEQGNGGLVEFTFEHVTGYAKMTVKGVELEDGQTVEKVTFTTTNDIAGNTYQYYINGGDNKFGSSSKTITVSGLNVDAKAAAAGFDVWFGAAPLDNITEFTVDVYANGGADPIATKTVKVEGDKNPLAFKAGRVSAFGVTVEKAVIETETYEQINDLASLEDGYYIIASDNGYAISNVTVSKNPAGVNLDNKLSGTTITAGDTDKYNWYIKATTGGYSIRSTVDPEKFIYLSCIDDNAGVAVGNNKMVWSIAEITNNCFNITAVPNADLRYLSLFTTNNDWRTYKNSAQSNATSKIKLYKKQGDNTWTGSEEVDQPTETEHKGTVEDPFSVADAILTATQTGTTATSEFYYIKGKITSIKYTFSAQYGTATFDIVDEGESATLTAYTLKYFNNTAWVEGNTQIKVGDEVVIYGNILNYNNTTPEATNGYLYSLNGKTTDTDEGEEPGGDGEDETAYYQKITSTNELTDGEYLIVYETGKVAFDGSSTNLSGADQTVNVVINSSKIEWSESLSKSEFTFTASNDSYTIKSASGYYIGRNASSNGLDSNQTTTYVNTITFDNNGNVKIAGNGGAVLQYNTSGNYIRYYTSTQKSLQLYKKIGNSTTGGGTETPGGDGEDNGKTEYTLELTYQSLGLTTSSYADNNKTHTVTATANDNSAKTLDVDIYTYQVYQNSSVMQWQKTNSYIQNQTSIGTIKSIKIVSTAGSYNVYGGTQEGPSTSISGSNGTYNFSSDYDFFKIKEAGTAAGKVTSVTIIFEK